MKLYDVVIIGAGAAGLSAGIYCARCYRLNALIIGKDFGQMGEAFLVENYPGFKGVTGMELAKKFKEHALSIGANIKEEEVSSIEKKGKTFIIRTKEKNTYQSKTVILAMGTARRKLNIPGELEFLGKGISYCATCDAPLFKDKTAGVVGGSNAAATSALLLAGHARKVYIFYRKEKLRADPVWVEKIEKNKKIEIINNAEPIEIKGNKTVRSVLIKRNGKKEEILLDGLLIEIGSVPSIGIVNKLGVATDKNGNIKVDSAQKTNVEGVFAAGDITNGSNMFRQIITASAEGAIAANSVFNYVKNSKIFTA